MYFESYPENLDPKFMRYVSEPQNVGLLDSPSGQGRMTGQCGDTISVSIRVERDAITEIGVLPEGCAYTLACAGAVSVLAKGKTLDQALELETDDVVRELGGLPEDHIHCARLALNTLGEAITDHLEHAAARP